MNSRRTYDILLVEDNPGDVVLTREALCETGLSHRLEVCTNGGSALRYLTRQTPFEDRSRPDLILMDLNLPVMDGRELLERIKNDEQLRSIPVLVLTTSNAERDIIASYEQRANCYINKPLDFDQFVRLIRKVTAFWLERTLLPTTPQTRS